MELGAASICGLHTWIALPETANFLSNFWGEHAVGHIVGSGDFAREVLHERVSVALLEKQKRCIPDH